MRRNYILLSIIIPVKDDSKIIHLLKKLISLNIQTYDKFELIVACNGSTRSFEESIKKCLNGINNSKVITIKKSGISLAKNTGIINSSGAFLYFLDSDCDIPNSILEDCENCISIASKYKNTIVMGKCLFRSMKTSTLSKYDSILKKRARLNAAHNHSVYTPNILVPRNVFHKFGMFPVTTPRLPTGEDAVWGTFSITKGLKVVYNPHLTVSHYSSELDMEIISGWVEYAQARCYKTYYFLKETNNFTFFKHIKCSFLGTNSPLSKKDTAKTKALYFFYYSLRTVVILRECVLLYFRLIFQKSCLSINFPKLKMSAIES
jgi:glycosyltransferase involved in cell wall biosynthesis